MQIIHHLFAGVSQQSQKRIQTQLADLLHHNFMQEARMRNTTVTITASEEDQKILDQHWEKAGIGNDYIFSCVMRKEGIFLQLMQRIFPELHLSKVEKHSPQMTFYGPAGSKSVRYDVYSEIDGRVFDVEMQLSTRKNEPKRTRYYQCLMDEQVLHQGEDYARLPDSYVVMISPQDLFHQGRHMYRFRNYEQTDRNLELRDGTTKVFLNTTGKGNDILPELKNFLNLINGDEPADEFCEEVEKEVWATKQDAETRRNFMDFEYAKMLAEIDAREKGHREGMEQGLEEGRKEGWEEGRKEGRKEARLEMAASLIRDEILTLSDASSRFSLSEKEISDWIRKNG